MGYHPSHSKVMTLNPDPTIKTTICLTVMRMLQEFQPLGSLFRNSTDGEFRITWCKSLFGLVWCSACIISSTHLCRIGVNLE